MYVSNFAAGKSSFLIGLKWSHETITEHNLLSLFYLKKNCQ